MANADRIAAVAGKLSRLKARHNDLLEEISELQDELAAINRDRKRKPAERGEPAARPRSSGHADEFDDDDDEPGDGDDDDDEEPEDDNDRRRTRGRRR